MLNDRDFPAANGDFVGEAVGDPTGDEEGCTVTFAGEVAFIDGASVGVVVEFIRSALGAAVGNIVFV